MVTNPESGELPPRWFAGKDNALLLDRMKNKPELEIPTETIKTPSRQTLRGLDWLNFFLASVLSGAGPCLAIYLAGHGWDEQRVGIAFRGSSIRRGR
jgi:hypothetical protein